MAQPSSRTVWCAFADDLEEPFPIDCAVNVDTIGHLKKKIWMENQQKLAQIGYPQLKLYSPINPVTDTLMKEDLVHLCPRDRISSDFPRSNDPEIDIILFQPHIDFQHKVLLPASGAESSLQTIEQAFPKGTDALALENNPIHQVL